MSPKGKLWTVAIAAGVIGALIGAGAVWAWVQNTPDTSAADAAQFIMIKEQLDQRNELIESLKEQLTSLATSDAVAPTETATASAGPKTSRQFAFVTAVTAGAKPALSADYAQFLTGKEAEAAASARGDESPPPNDYYILNENQKLRTLSVKPGITVILTARSDGSSVPAGFKAPFATWAGFYASPTQDTAGITEGPYWLTITDGIVTAIEEQYTP